MSQIQALEAIYHSNQDRMLFTIVMADSTEHKFWLTRRYSKLLLSALDQLIKAAEPLPNDNRTLSKNHSEQNSTRNATAEAFALTQSTPLPLLAAHITARSGDQSSLFLGLFDEEHRGLELSASKELYQSIQQLLQKTLLDAEWDF